MASPYMRSEEHTSELQSRFDLVCRLLLEKKKQSEYTEDTSAQTHPFGDRPALARAPALAMPLLRMPLALAHFAVPLPPSSLCRSIPPATTEIYTLSLHDALPISQRGTE